MHMNKLQPSLNLLRLEYAFMLKWLTPDELGALGALEECVKGMSYMKYQWLEYGVDGDVGEELTQAC